MANRSPITTNPPTPTTSHGYTYDSVSGYSNIALARASDGPSTTPGKQGRTRAVAPDLLRGLLMMLMALDHTAIVLHTWRHGTGRVSEADGQVVRRWNHTTAYIVRTLTHLCGPGFTFLLGMGVVYLGRSRTALGWSSLQLARYFAVRCVVLTAVAVVFGLVLTGGRVWLLNAVLFSLAVDYLVAGLLWLAINKTEVWLALAIAKMRKRKDWRDGHRAEYTADEGDEDRVRRPLLRQQDASWATADIDDGYLSWTIHNVVLLALSLVTIFWNIWLSDTGGVCAPIKRDVSRLASPANPLLRIWFWVTREPGSRIMSGFPPMAWLSFAVLGMLYGRIVTARPWTRRALVLGHVCAATCLSILFVLTRVLHFGNLSEQCLQTPDQEHRPGRNPYLASAASFFYVVKYPPDVAFLAFTMAGNLLLLALFTALPPRIASRFTMLLDFGTSALFFYIVHLVVLIGAGMLVVAAFGHETGVPDPLAPEKTRGIDNLFGYFGFYAVVMLLLWPVCRAYSRFKSSKGADSIWRFF